eukprot:GFUD01095855.1.p1 GENE.GFUD01095855.1~~GFUD01095855.1.p1  ORF type:complete len:266 (-),score=11.24 GFUD01095855.1:171-968(-)
MKQLLSLLLCLVILSILSDGKKTKPKPSIVSTNKIWDAAQGDTQTCYDCLNANCKDCIAPCYGEDPGGCLQCIKSGLWVPLQPPATSCVDNPPCPTCLAPCGYPKIARWKITTPTTTTTLLTNDGQCSQGYNILNEQWRKVHYSPGGVSSCSRKCDSSNYGFSAGWYRFMEPAGFKLPINPPSSFGTQCDVCQTSVSAWIKEGRDPTYGEGVININICFAWGSTACAWTNTAKAVACKDNSGSLFYLYFLNLAPGCDMAYCALGS